MSFMIFVQFFENNKPAEIATSRIKEIFGSAYSYDEDIPDLKYAADEFPELYGEFGQERISDFSVASPPISIEFWNSLYKILKIEGAVLLIPGLEGVAAANSESKNHLPDDMLSSLPRFIQVSSPVEIVELIEDG